jgi:hypothetical protein
MEENSKEIYEVPTLEVVAVQAEGVICESIPIPDWGDAQEI